MSENESLNLSGTLDEDTFITIASSILDILERHDLTGDDEDTFITIASSILDILERHDLTGDEAVGVMMDLTELIVRAQEQEEE